MITANADQGLFGFARRRRRADDPDAADMGTCFGLDMSLDDTPPATPAAEAPAAPSWWQRLAGRRPALG